MQNKAQKKDQNPELSLAISARGLCKSYGETTALNGLDLVIPKGQCLALLGPNGAGKSTTIKILSGMTTADKGQVQIFGKSWSKNKSELRQSVGLVMQETNLYKRFSVLETLQLFHSFYRNPKKILEVSEQLNLTKLHGKHMGDLSGGQKQLVHLASTLIGNPSFLLLDEPTVGLDIDTRNLFWGYIKEYLQGGGTVFIATHYFEEAMQLATHVSILSAGKTVAHGPLDTVLENVALQGPAMVDLQVNAVNADRWAKTLKAAGLKVQKSAGSIAWKATTPKEELERIAHIAKEVAGFESIRFRKPDIQQAYEQLTQTPG